VETGTDAAKTTERRGCAPVAFCGCINMISATQSAWDGCRRSVGENCGVSHNLLPPPSFPDPSFMLVADFDLFWPSSWVGIICLPEPAPTCASLGFWKRSHVTSSSSPCKIARNESLLYGNRQLRNKDCKGIERKREFLSSRFRFGEGGSIRGEHWGQNEQKLLQKA